MSYRNNSRKNKSDTIPLNEKITKNEKIEDENTKNDDSTSFSSSSSNKKYGKKNKRNNLNFSNINYSIYDNPIANKKNKENQKNELSSITEENNSNSKKDENENQNKYDNDDSFCLLEDNKVKKNSKKTNIKNDDTNEKKTLDKEIEDIINKNIKKRKLKKDKDKKKEEQETINITDSDNEDNKAKDPIQILSDEDDDISEYKNKKKSKNKKYPKKEASSKVNSKSKIDLEFLDIEEKEKESENDFKYYIQKPFDEEEDYKIIYEFNKLPFKPKTFIIDLSVFDDESIFKCISYCYFDKSDQKFILKLFFVYLSKESELYNNKNCEDEIMNFFNEKYEENDIESKNEDESQDNENDDYSDNKVELKVFLKRFKFVKGYPIQTGYKLPKIYKKDKLEDFHLIKIEEKEDLVNYINYHKIFYVLKLEKKLLIQSKKSLPEQKIGIRNEGNTCYMNSIIQSIYNNPFLLKSIMSINPDSEEFMKAQVEKSNNKEANNDNNIIASLQSIFYKLYKYKYAITITEIFKAFEWNKAFWNSPQDAEEIYMQIYEIISAYNEDIKNNCEGILENTIEVVEKKYKSTNEENFFFLQLDIENNHSLDDCLEHFFNVEELNGDNKYQYIDTLGNKSLHDANKFYKFKKIPNILFIQLKRFEYDPNEETFYKKNNGISFKEEIDLSNYLNNKNSKRSKKKNKEEYVLYCVIVHSGTAQNGHYFCFVKNFKNNCYIKFNDTTVYMAEKKEVFNQIFGGEEIEYSIYNVNKKKDKDPKYEVKNKNKEISKNAYIFIYIKKDKIKNLFNDDEIDKIFKEYSKNKKEEEIKKEKKESSSNKKIDDYINNFIQKSNNNSSNRNYKGVGPKKKNSLYSYNRGMPNRKSKSNNINMNYEFNGYRDLLNQMNSSMIDYDNIHNNENNNNYNNKKLSTKKRITMIDLGIGNSIAYRNQNCKNISSMNYPMNGLNDTQIFYYLIDEISNRIRGIFLLKYNTKIKVGEVPSIIREQLQNEKIQQKNLETFEKIVNSNGYKLALVNCLGMFIKFIDNDNDYDITRFLKNDDDKSKIKHLCLYNLPKFNKDSNNNIVISITFISNSLLDQIISKNNDIYDNLNCYQINIPAFIINEDLETYENLTKRINDIYVDYFRNRSEKNKQFKIYATTDDILNIDILKINYSLVDEFNYIMYFAYSKGNTTIKLIVGH